MSDSPPDDPRYEIRNEQAEQALRGIGTLIAGSLPPNFGFALFLFEFGPNGAVFYLANGERADLQTMLREWLAREGGH